MPFSFRLTDKALLSSHQVIAPADRERMASGLYGDYGVRGVDFALREQAFTGAANRVRLDGLTLHYCRYDTETRIDFPAGAGYRQFFCLSGAGDIQLGAERLILDPTQTVALAPGREISATYGDNYRQLVAQFDEPWLRRKAALITGAEPRGALIQGREDARPLDERMRLRFITLSLALQFSGDAPPSPIVVTELAEALGSAFLMENGLRLEPRAGAASRADVARLEDYIRAHWAEPLTVEAMAAACGISVRSVFQRFKEQHGRSPMAYLRAVRLDEAQALLLSGAGAASVMEIAMTCGFSSFGHFARRYRERFGELPSETLERRRIG